MSKFTAWVQRQLRDPLNRDLVAILVYFLIFKVIGWIFPPTISFGTAFGFALALRILDRVRPQQ